MESPIYLLPQLFEAVVLARPSKVCKSPYLADIMVNGGEENVMAHTPALGCCGMIVPGARVLCTKSSSEKNKSKYVIHHVIDKDESIIGVNPMLGNPIVESLLLNHKIPQFQNITQLESEHTVKGWGGEGEGGEEEDDESRFDFTFVNESGARVYCEVKCVPLADIVDVSKKDRKKIDESKYDMKKKIAIFPDGYRRKKSEPVSERALKHVNHLRRIKEAHPEVECALIFLIQRTDVVAFKPSSLDPIYQKALYQARDAGVEIIPFCVEWCGSECYERGMVPMI
jgi:DNA-binding sugar fermentation-stimulating protein